MASQCKDFENALSLYTKCASLGHPEWVWIAARDSGMSIYHFATAMEGAGTWGHQSPTLSSKIRNKYQGDAWSLLRQKFPKFERARNAIAHTSDIIKNPAAVGKHSFSGSHQGEAISINNVSGFTVKMLDNDIYTTNWVGEMQQHKIASSTLDTLIEIAETFFYSFE
jgi:hypothetical protein